LQDKPNERNGRSILLIGLGDLGSVLLEFLAREPAFDRIRVASLLEEEGEARCNLARISALAHGFTPEIDFHRLDLNDTEQTAELVSRLNPDILISTATLQTWWLADLLPEPHSSRIKRAGFGVWLPVNLTLTLKLMRALRDCGYRGLSLTAPFPDVANVVLARLGLAPTCGIGNVDEVVAKVRIAAARSLGVSTNRVDADLVAHHAIQKFTLGRRSPASKSDHRLPPFYLRVYLDGEDATDRIDPAVVLFSAFPITPGPASHFLTAGSALRLFRALCRSEPSRLHAPAPGGLPGGYPVWADREGVRSRPVPGLTLEQAVAINESSHRFDGIEAIEEDGTVRFLSESAATLKECLAYDCPRLPPDEIEERASELIGKFRKWAQSLGISLRNLPPR